MEKILSKLYDIDKINSYDKYINMFSNPSSIIIENVLPEDLLNQYKLDCKELFCKVKDLDKENYVDNIINYKEFLDNFDQIKINVLAYKAFCEVESNETILSTLKSFKPTKGFTNKVSYNFTF